MAKRKIIKIDEGKCNGCGVCIPNCPEGAIQMIDGKARLVSDLFCDGLGACLGHCPQGAITIEERQAGPYDETKVMDNIVKQGPNVIKAHLVHLKEHKETRYLKQATDYLKQKGILNPLGGQDKEGNFAHAHQGGCPGSRLMELKKNDAGAKEGKGKVAIASELANWPVQITLVPPFAPYLNNADILIAADCVPFAYANFHQDLLRGKVLLVGCPKLDDISRYKEKFIQMLENNDIRSITYAHMEVPCCFGMVSAVKEAISASGKKVPFDEVTISIKGERL